METNFGRVSEMYPMGRIRPIFMCESYNEGHKDYAEVHTDHYNVYNEYNAYEDYSNYHNCGDDPCGGGWS